MHSLWNRYVNRRFVVLLYLILAGWLLISYLTINFLPPKRLSNEIRRHAAELDQTAVAVNFHFDRSLSYLDIVPESIADNEFIRSALRTFTGQAGWQSDSPGSNRAFLLSRPELISLNRQLAQERRELRVDILWILDANGDCIASSNYDTPVSFVGINYSDRSYFKSAITGMHGRQYAVGRPTNIPGFFFSAPILFGGRAGAVVVAKIDVSSLAQWFSRFNCFVTDESGVSIISSEKKPRKPCPRRCPGFPDIPGGARHAV